MIAIIKKTVPVYWDKDEEILYFDELEEFDSSHFKYLEKSDKPFATHLINFKNFKNKKFNSKDKLDILVRRIGKKASENKIHFGFPLFYDDNRLYKPTIKDVRDEFFWNVDTELNCDNNNLKLVASNVEPSLKSVGQGLMFVDNGQKLIYDCGGTKTFKNEWLENNIEYSIVISHWHHDHYSYLNHIIDNFSICKIFVSNNLIIKSSKIKELDKKCKRKGIAVLGHNNIMVNSYRMIKSPSRAKTVRNTNSCILFSEKWILTGDQHTSFIDKMINNIDIDNFQIPHHMSDSHNQDPSKLKIKKIVNAHFSAMKGRYDSIPGHLAAKFYKEEGANLISANSEVFF